MVPISMGEVDSFRARCCLESTMLSSVLALIVCARVPESPFQDADADAAHEDDDVTMTTHRD